MTNHLSTQPFSAGYELVRGAEILTHSDEEAIMDFEMLDALRGQFGAPVVGYVGGLHYQFKPMQAIPPSTLALPESSHNDPEALLIKR